MRNASVLTLAACLVASGWAMAQTQNVVPAHAATADLHASSYFPFLYDKTRVQQLWDGKAIAPNLALISGIAFRQDANGSAYPSQSISSLTLSLGLSNNGPATMSTTFAANVAAPLTNVHTGPYNLPAAPAATGVGQFLVSFPIATPYMYTTAQGNLLLDFVIPGMANAKNEYLLDAVRTSAGGVIESRGVSGPFNNNDGLRLSATGTALPGNALNYSMTTRVASYPGTLFFGGSSAFWGSLALPFDLSVLGAPNNYLYTGIQVQVGMVMMPQPSGYAATSPINLPNDPGLAGGVLWAQSLVLHPNNALGVVFSNAVLAEIGGGNAITQVLAAGDSSAVAGFFLFGAGEPGGPVVRFTGVFG